MVATYLVGFMGSGKSTVGQYLSERLNQPLLDLDTAIEDHTKRQISEIFALHGEEYFRQVEHDLLILTSNKNQVVSTGGGIIERDDNREFLKEQRVVFLKTAWNEVIRRLEHDTTRPLWQQDLESKRILFDRRQTLYEAVSDVIIDTSILSPEQIAVQIVQAFK